MTVTLYHPDGSYIGRCEQPNTDREAIMQAYLTGKPIEAMGRQYRVKAVRAPKDTWDVSCNVEDLGVVSHVSCDD